MSSFGPNSLDAITQPVRTGTKLSDSPFRQSYDCPPCKKHYILFFPGLADDAGAFSTCSFWSRSFTNFWVLLILLPLLLVFLFGCLISSFAQPFFFLLEFNSPATGPAAIGCSLVQLQRSSWLAGWLPEVPESLAGILRLTFQLDYS